MKWTLKMLRISKDMLQSDVAAALGVNRKTISAWESGKSMPTVDKIDAICALYGVGYDEIKWKP